MQTNARSARSIERYAKDFSIVKTRPPPKPFNQRLGTREVVDCVNLIVGQDDLPFDGDGYCIAAAEAEGCDAALQIAALQFVEQGDEDARAGCTNRVSEGDRAAIYVYFFGVELQHAGYGNGRDREGFVQFIEVYVLVAVPASFLQEFFHGVDRSHHHPFGFDAADGLRDDARHGLFAEARGIFFAGDDHGCGAVVRARRVPCRHGAVFLERGFQLGENFQRRILARRFVRLDDDGLALLLRNFHRHDLRAEETGFYGANRFLMTFERELVLFLTRDFIFFSDQLAGDAHMKIFVHVP